MLDCCEILCLGDIILDTYCEGLVERISPEAPIPILKVESDKKKDLGGRRWAGKIRQLITGSVGLDDSEWGVTLFAKNSFEVKSIVYQMRFDEVSVKYGEFGDFYIGLQLPLDELFRRVGL